MKLFVLAAAAALVLPGSASSPLTAAGRAEPGPASSAKLRGTSAWDWPVWPYPVVVRAFDPPDEPWLAGHRGVDLDVPAGTEVRAPDAGVVTFSGMVAGRGIITVRIGRYKSTVLPITHRARQGTHVGRGDVLGTVAASPRHCDGTTCLHWGVRLGDGYVDPLEFTMDTAPSMLLPMSRAPQPLPRRRPGRSGPSESNRWGGFTNGRIPERALCPLRHAPAERLRCDAARSVVGLDRAFRARFGIHIGITDAYRDYASQVRLKREKGYLAATPGTSNHGWGVAVDFGTGINRFGSASYRWMKRHAGRFGWHHPSWAEQGSSKPEPWHWEFG